MMSPDAARFLRELSVHHWLGYLFQQLDLMEADAVTEFLCDAFLHPRHGSIEQRYMALAQFIVSVTMMSKTRHLN